jgi:hypothetical protein
MANSDGSSSSTESQHAQKQDTLERELDKSRTLLKERSTQINLQWQIDKQKKVNNKKMIELAEASCCYPTEDEVHNLTNNHPYRINLGYFSY